MDELISRAEAIRIASGYCHPANIVKELEKLPSVQPRNGKWLYRDGTIAEEYTYSVYCSECGEWSEYYTNFCGSCGADMRGDTE